MANARRKRKQSHAYDTGKPEDAAMTRLLRDCGMSLSRRYTQGEVNALLALTDEQRARLKHTNRHSPINVEPGYAGPSFEQTRIKDNEGEKVTQAIRISTLPKSLWWLHERRLSAVEEYQALFEAVTPDGAVSLQPRMSGGSISNDPYDHDAMRQWSNARKQMGRAEVKLIETFLRAPDDALVGTHQVYAINSGAAKLAEYFERKGDI